MSTNLRIAYRFLTSRRRAMIMSLSCIMLGVGLFVVTQATTSGFEKFFKDTIVGSNGAIVIADRIQETIRSMEGEGGGSDSSFRFQIKEGRRYIEGIEEPVTLAEAVKAFTNVKGVSIVVAGSAEMRSSSKSAEAKIYGIELDDHLAVSDLGKQIVQGNLTTYRSIPNAVLVGSKLAERLELQLDDTFVLQNGDEIRRYRIAGIFQTGIGDIDKVRVFMPIREARSFLRKRAKASYLQVALLDRERAPLDAQHMEEVLHHSAAAWQDLEKTWLEVFRALRISTGITVSVFTLIAGLAMYNTLALIVMEKTKDIAILRSMGFERRDITRIFLWQAVIVLSIGAVLGSGLGWVVTLVVERVPLRIQGIFATDHFLVLWSGWHYVTGVGISVVMVMVASLIPARRAARLEPGDVIRGTAQ